VYLEEVLGRTLRGEVQDPYNVQWNTLQALLRRAFVREEMLNPSPIFDAAWLFFFLRPVVSLTIVAITLFAIFRARQRNILAEYGAIIAMISLITPSQAGYHQFLFYPAVTNGIAQSKRASIAFGLAGIFALICSNVMRATAGFDSGAAMIFAFPRVYLVTILWVFFLFTLKPPRPALGSQFLIALSSILLIFMGMAFMENRRWTGDVADRAVLVPMPPPSFLEIQPRFEGDRLITSSLNRDGLSPLPPKEGPAVSPDGRWIAYATNIQGNWDIALRSTRTGEVRFLTTSSANDLTPTFSPDGKSVYFASDRHRGYRFTAIYRIDVDVH
jgi:WD40-like Beta Propeller Repeat